jgi:hypothetical protein
VKAVLYGALALLGAALTILTNGVAFGAWFSGTVPDYVLVYAVVYGVACAFVGTFLFLQEVDR